MSLQVEKLENNMAKLTIEVPANDLEKALQSAYMKQKNKIAMPGFRKGKVPRQMIEKMYGPEIFYDDAANALIPKAYSEAYDECDLEIVSRPEINIVQIEKGKSFIFTADVATKPEVKLGEYKGLEVDKVSTRVTQKEVDAKIQEEAEKNAREVVVTDRPVADGDEVILDFEGFVDGEAFEGGKGENYPLTIGSGSFIPGFEEQLVGAEAEKEVEVKVTFPEDYHAEELKGKEAVFKCTVHESKAKELPELDDEFASEVSELCQSKALLKKENQKLQEMSAAMKALSKNVVTLTREEETLSMKMRVHDNLGYSVLATQRMLMRESEEDRDMFLSQWKQTLDLLNKDNESVEGEQLHRQVQERAKVLGVKIIYTGEKVWESHISELMDIILLEALSNCVRHAGASELYVKFSIEEQEWVMVLTDNGQKPEKNIKEGGGLSGIRKRVEQCGGSMRITAAPRFSITVKLLREVRR